MVKSKILVVLAVFLTATSVGGVQASAQEGSRPPMERLSPGFEGCAAHGSLEACNPDQLERDRQLFNSLTDEEWNSLPQEMRDFWGPLRSSDGSGQDGYSELLYDSEAGAWYVYYPETGEWYWY